MSRHFDQQIEKLKKAILAIADLVEQNMANAIVAFENQDVELGLEVIFADSQIDQLEVDLGEECLQTIALYQPVASDMRFVGSLLTINKDLERIGDLSVNLAEQALILAREPRATNPPHGLRDQLERVSKMVRESLDALVESDGTLARQVIAADDAVDRIHREMYQTVKDSIRDEPHDAGALIDYLIASRLLERIADHAVNIAVDVIYMVRGEIVRHNQPEASVPSG